MFNEKKFKEIGEILKKSIKIIKSIYGYEHLKIAKILAIQSKLLLSLSKKEAAYKKADKYIDLIEKLFGTEHTNYAHALRNKASVLKIMQNLKSFMEYIQKSNSVFRQVYPFEHIEVQKNMIDIYLSETYKGNTKGFKEKLLESIGMIYKCYGGEDSIDGMEAKYNLVSVLSDQGDYKESIKLLEEIIMFFQNNFQDSSTYVQSVYLPQANIYFNL